jgi:ATP-dependent DNA helicase RecQ
VDEAHCISQWGYDFRPPYLRIAAIRKELPGVPVLALTASATPEVQDDICEKLGFARKNIFRQSFERPRLSYSVFRIDSRINKIIDILLKVPGSGIVYCKSRKRTKEISELLKLRNISADHYHAGLTQEERNNKQEDWINNRTRVIVCTNAFGMGIDKPDVRCVIHADVPDCLENYYQEAGRAGRDGKTAYAVLLFEEKDIAELEAMVIHRFPTLDDMRQVYQAVANYLQIPSGEGAGKYYDFDISDFLKKFKLNSHLVLYSLKALEQEGWLAFNEQVFLSASLQFTTSKDHLYEFEKNYPAFEPMIKTLLRSYEGIFDQFCPISEWILSGLLKKDIPDVKEELNRLHQFNIIEYRPQKQDPQLVLLRERIKSEDLTINMQAYLQRKEKFGIRVKEMIRFVRERSECRSRMIASYFGDHGIQACGICDNCLSLKSITMSKEEFDTLHHRIINMVKYESLFTRDILAKLNDIKKEKAWKVIEFLQAEQKIDMDSTGKVKLR